MGPPVTGGWVHVMDAQWGNIFMANTMRGQAESHMHFRCEFAAHA